MVFEQWEDMAATSNLYSTKDPYLSVLNNDNFLFGTSSSGLSKPKAYTNGRLDPLAFAPREGEDGEKEPAEDEPPTEDTESEPEEWPTAPPVDYLERVQVLAQ